MQELDPLGIGSYMRTRMRELLGPEGLGIEPFDTPRFALDEPSGYIEGVAPVLESSIYINPEVEWAFPEADQLLSVGKTSERPRGHRPIPGGVGTEILESSNSHPSKPPRRLFRVDVTENDNYYFLRADLAGMTKENVQISVVEDQNLVAIHVEPPKDDFYGIFKSAENVKEKEPVVVNEKEPETIRKEEIETIHKEVTHEKEPSQTKYKHAPIEPSNKTEVCHLIERCNQPATRSLKMPKAVDMSRIEAEMRDGLLVVKFSKIEPEVVSMKKHTIEIK